MEGLFMGLMIFATVLAIIGLVLVFLQKKGKVSSFTTMTASGPNYVSVGKTVIVPVLSNLSCGLHIDTGTGEIV